MAKRCTDVAVCEKACEFCYCWVCDTPWKQCKTWKEHCICDGGVEWNLKRQKVPSATPPPRRAARRAAPRARAVHLALRGPATPRAPPRPAVGLPDGSGLPGAARHVRPNGHG